MKTRQLTGCIGIVAAGCVALSASAGVIDAFSSVDVGDDGISPWPVTLHQVGSVNVLEGGLSDVLGGVRKSTVSLTSVAVPGLDAMNMSIVPEMGLLLDYAASTGADGEVNLLYDGAGKLHADFTQELSIIMQFADFDFAFAAPLPVTITLSDGTNSADLTRQLSAAGPGSLTFALANFAGIGSVNLADITSVNVHLNPGLAADYRLTGITTESVPAPAAWSLLALSGVVGSRRRRR